MAAKILHQFTEGAYEGDAVTDHALQIRTWLRDSGYFSEIFAEIIQDSLLGDILDVRSYQPSAGEKFIIYHHAVGSIIATRLQKFNLPFVLIYHNITPAKFFEDTNPALVNSLRLGRKQLADLREKTLLAMTVSPYNENELLALGYSQTAIVPIVLNEAHYNVAINERLAEKLRLDGPLLLFVGRLVPNKRQEDLILLLYFFRRLVPAARLVLIGSLDAVDYVRFLQDVADSVNLQDGAVTFAGHVSQQDLVTYYRLADMYVSMSEHEGFGKPFLESMYLNLPILAFGAAAVPDTVADSGLLVYRKDFEKIAELMDIILNNQELRRRIIARQQQRVQDFLEPRVKKQFLNIISKLETS